MLPNYIQILKNLNYFWYIYMCVCALQHFQVEATFKKYCLKADKRLLLIYGNTFGPKATFLGGVAYAAVALDQGNTFLFQKQRF